MASKGYAWSAHYKEDTSDDSRGLLLFRPLFGGIMTRENE
jgi:hypothetical protein